MVPLYITVLGILCSITIFALEKTVKPGVNFSAWKKDFRLPLIHLSIFSFLYFLMVLLTGRLIFAAALVILLDLVLVVINYAKYRNLCEPLVFSDYDYFTDAFRFPRLYLPFLGVYGFLGIFIAAVLLVLGFCLDTSAVDRFSGKVLITCITGLAATSIILYLTRNIKKYNSFHPDEDLRKLGFSLYVWSYFLAYLEKPPVISPFENFSDLSGSSDTDLSKLPHLMAVQSESFFDPRKWNPDIRTGVLQDFDAICRESPVSGLLRVPAWGANTIRTEFSFLTGIAPEAMGGHQFSPYQISSRSWHITSFVNYLKKAGYHTICVHPYYKRFYHRNIIFKKWGFDEFIDISSFTENDRFGPYTSDEAVKNYVLSRFAESRKNNAPLFVFAITMENHGPLHLESITDEECTGYFNKPVTPEYRDLAKYLRHLANENNMLKELIAAFNNMTRPVSLAFYGDHVPILPEPYSILGKPDGRVPFFVYHCGFKCSRNQETPVNTTTDNENMEKYPESIEELSVYWLNLVRKLQADSRNY